MVAAILVKDIEDVLEANIVSLGAILSRVENIFYLMLKSSLTASIIKSASFNSSRVVK